MGVRWRVDGLRKDQKQESNNEEKQVDEQECSEKSEVGENAGSITSTKFFHGRVPQLERGRKSGGISAMAPHLEANKPQVSGQ